MSLTWQQNPDKEMKIQRQLDEHLHYELDKLLKWDKARGLSKDVNWVEKWLAR